MSNRRPWRIPFLLLLLLLDFAPVCKGILGSMFVTCSALKIPMFAYLRQYIYVSVPDTLISSRIWHLVFNRLSYINTKDIFLAAFIMYYFRIFERRMGSRKFGSYLFCNCTVATLLEILVLLMQQYFLNGDFSRSALFPGLNAVIFPLFVKYYLDIPSFPGLNFLCFNSKAIPYLFGVQLALTEWSSGISAMCGILGGILYQLNILKIQSWLKIPNFMSNILSRTFGRLLQSTKPKEMFFGATLELQRQEQADYLEQQFFQHQRAQNLRHMRGQGYAERLVPNQDEDTFLDRMFGSRARHRNMEPSEENIQVLVDMGFDRDRAREALRSSNNNLETATVILLRN